MNKFRSLYSTPEDARYVLAEDLSIGDVLQWMETISMPMIGEITSLRTKGAFLIVDVQYADRARPGKLARKRFSLAAGTLVLTRTNAVVVPRGPIENIVPIAKYVRRNRNTQQFQPVWRNR